MTRRSYALVLLGAFLVYASANAVIPIASELRDQLGAPGSGAGMFLAPFAAGFGVGTFLWLLIARGRPSRTLLVLALLGVAAAGLLLVLSTSTAAAVASRTALGLTAAGYPAAAQAMITRTSVARSQGRNVSGFVIAVVAGSFIGQALVGAIADLADVRLALSMTTVAAPIGVAILLAKVLPSERTADQAPPSPRIGAATRTVAPVLVVAASSFGSYWLLLSQLSTVLRESRFELTAAAAGAVPLLGLLGILSAIATGRATDAFGPRTPMAATLTAGIVAITITIPAGPPLAVFIVAYGIFLAAYWGYMAPASAEIARRTTGDTRQAVLMAFYAAMWLGAAVAPLVGTLISTWQGVALATAAAWLVAATTAAATFSRTPL